ncbi:breast carcinoma-amplified sequence 1 [Esox lucius]|uniref:breast carcinoma-amplified sequence 1 n=1 Tax=Esox lucius TaxID=8010 RepID=UPI0009733552|nr:breast carcinoma-amplified sequence 1 [Esox lucius]
MGNEHSKNTSELPHEKHQNGGLNGHAMSISSNDPENDVTCETAVEQNSTPPLLPPSAEPAIVEPDSSCPGLEVVKEEPVIKTVPQAEPETHDAKSQTTPEPEPAPQEKEPKNDLKEKVNIFNKLLKKKVKPQPTPNPDPDPKMEEAVEEKAAEDSKSSPVNPTVSEKVTEGIQAVSIQAEPRAEARQDPDTLEEPPNPILEEEEVKHPDIDQESIHLQEKLEESQATESQADKNSVMNFFKTLMTPTKKNKQDSTTPDVATDQPYFTFSRKTTSFSLLTPTKSQKEPHPTATTTVAQVVDAPTAAKGGMSYPPPPPPAPVPPKMEVKAELAAQPVTNSPKEEQKGAAKEPDATKPKVSSPFSKLFSKKTAETVEPLTVLEVQKIDASKTATLEASAKPEPLSPSLEEDKKAASTKASSFASISLFKPKDLLNQMASKVQVASTSGVRFLKKPFKGAAEPKKEAPAQAAEVIAGPSVAKEEPKIPEAPAVNSKPVSGPPEDGENTPVLSKRLEKRNSIHLFFKNLGKRQSDAGVQTEPEKTK